MSTDHTMQDAIDAGLQEHARRVAIHHIVTAEPTPESVAHLRRLSPHAEEQWLLGISDASRHHRQASIVDPTRSVLSEPNYCRGMGDMLWQANDAVKACYWYGYAAQAVRLDPSGGRVLAAR